MSQWPFVIAAYSVALIGTTGLLALTYFSMRRAESEAEKVRARE